MELVNFLIELIDRDNDSFGTFVDHLKNKKKVIIWGTGIAGGMLYDSCKRLSIPIFAFTDGSGKDYYSRTFCGATVMDPKDIDADSFVLVEANVDYDIHKILVERKINYSYIDPFYISDYEYGYSNTIKKVYLDNKDRIEYLYDILKDEKSKVVLKNVLIHRAIHKIELLWDVYERNQYFGNDIIQKVKGSFVDCGAYNGDTLKCFLEQLNGGEYCYYAIEPEEENFNELKGIANKAQKEFIHLYQVGLWDEMKDLYFQLDSITGKETGKIIDTPDVENTSIYDKIHVDTIDNIIGGGSVDYIKMDIEGAELRALKGGEKTIKNNLPILGISAYHEMNHLWEVPLMIKKLNPKYNIFLRHHMWNMVDTVCYGLIDRQ